MALDEKSDREKQPQEDAESIVKQKVISCFKGVRLLKTLIIMGCIVIVLQQISACVKKLLIDVPVTTYTHFDFNKTIMYPSVTFCREPPYKFERMMSYGLSSHPRITTAWRNFNYSINLDDLWDDITYSELETFVQFALNENPENVELSSTTGFALGRCYTLSPKVLGTRASQSAGYSIMVRHSAEDLEDTGGISPPGYHVFIHYTKEPFTEVEVYNGGLVQNFFLNVGETATIKLTVDEYVKISDEDDPCTYEANYSANVCTEQYVWDQVGQTVGCSGPWMISDLPHCANFNDMRDLITAYNTAREEHSCASCPRICRSYLYNAFVMDRQKLYIWDNKAQEWSMKTYDAALQTQLYIYFNSMMVSVYEERYNYDWNLFVSDLGGSIGFLLGLSVIGIIKIFGKTWQQFIRPFVKTPRNGSLTSAVTTDVAVKFPDDKDTEWKKMGD